MKKLTIAMFVMMVLSIVSYTVAQEAAPAPAAPAPAAAQEAAPAPAAEEAAAPAASPWKFFLIPFGCGLVVVGGGFGIGRIGAAAVDSMARQPESASAIQTAMILSAALVEGATLFGLVICLLGYIL
ncbi:MAG: ATP synthase F0 subunit C [Planctomycetia bacterium]|nr:ATP synthase F0 subunit C [Planctomycetia bacterium]